MKRVIDGKSYNTDTARYICDLQCSAQSRSDFHWHDTALYLSPGGRYFIAGEGGPMSMWRRTVGNAYSNGEGMRLVTMEKAREFAESAELDPEAMQAAGFSVEEG